MAEVCEMRLGAGGMGDVRTLSMIEISSSLGGLFMIFDENFHIAHMVGGRRAGRVA